MLVLQTIVGTLFAAGGVVLAVVFFCDAVKDKSVDAFTFAAVFVPLLMAAAGVFLLVVTGREIRRWARTNKAQRSDVFAQARIADSKVKWYKDTVDRRFALVLSYEHDGETKTFTTDFLFDVNEFRYLSSLPSVRVKVDGDFVAVAESFAEEIYTVDSRFEIETAFLRQKHARVLLTVWKILGIVSLALLVLSAAATFATGKELFLFLAVSLLTAANLPCGVVFVVFYFRWKRTRTKNKDE